MNKQLKLNWNILSVQCIDDDWKFWEVIKFNLDDPIYKDYDLKNASLSDFYDIIDTSWEDFKLLQQQEWSIEKKEENKEVKESIFEKIKHHKKSIVFTLLWLVLFIFIIIFAWVTADISQKLEKESKIKVYWEQIKELQDQKIEELENQKQYRQFVQNSIYKVENLDRDIKFYNDQTVKFSQELESEKN